MQDKKNNINWQPLIEIGIVFAAVFGTVVPLYIHTDGKLHSSLSELRQESNELRKEFYDLLKEVKENRNS